MLIIQETRSDERGSLSFLSKILSKILVFVLLLAFLGVGLETARAQTGWVRSSSNPVLSPGSTGWDSREVLIPRLYYDESKYEMWYSGDNGKGFNTVGFSIGYATSTDGISWTKNPNPVLMPGAAGSWDSEQVSAGFVLKNASAYLLWYAGDQKKPDGTCCVYGVGLARSADGISWNKYAGNPVLTPDANRPYITEPWVLLVDGQFKMWYACGDRAGFLVAICFATSPDGIHWSKNASPVFRGTGGTNDWDGGPVYSPNVIYEGTAYGMWYSGTNSAGTKYQVGYATSSDGITWTRASGNPILGPSPISGAWDSYDSVDNQGILQVGGSFMLYYSADQLSSSGKYVSYKIGLAQSPVGFVLPEFHDFGISIMLPVLFIFSMIAINSHRKRLSIPTSEHT